MFFSKLVSVEHYHVGYSLFWIEGYPWEKEEDEGFYNVVYHVQCFTRKISNVETQVSIIILNAFWKEQSF